MEPVVPRLGRVIGLVWLGVAALLGLRALPPAAPTELGWVEARGGCVLGELERGSPCPCAALPAAARVVLGLPLPLNEAGAGDLERLAGIGPVRAAAIAEHRATRGPFQGVESLERVRGIGPATVRALRPHLFVGAPDPACAHPLH